MKKWKENVCREVQTSIKASGEVVFSACIDARECFYADKYDDYVIEGWDPDDYYEDYETGREIGFIIIGGEDIFSKEAYHKVSLEEAAKKMVAILKKKNCCCTSEEELIKEGERLKKILKKILKKNKNAIALNEDDDNAYSEYALHYLKADPSAIWRMEMEKKEDEYFLERERARGDF